jgi:hypothetical protein
MKENERKMTALPLLQFAKLRTKFDVEKFYRKGDDLATQKTNVTVSR